MADWKNIGVPRWFDCKLGSMKDEDLARLVGTAKSKIRYRRQLFGIAAWRADMAIEPYRHLLGIESIRTIARLCGVSAYSVDQYRKRQGVKARTRPGYARKPKLKPIPANHPLRPYKPLLGLVHDDEVAELAKVSRATVKQWREALGLEPAKPLPKEPSTRRFNNYEGPGLGYESLLGTMSVAKISRATGVPYVVIERRQAFLGATPYKRTSKLVRYRHLVGLISNGLLAELAGVSTARATEFSTQVRAGQRPV